MKVDMSSEAVTARLKVACGLGDIERWMIRIRELTSEIRSESAPAGKSKKKKKHKDARARS